jgi:predicted transcriptional regulator
MHRFDLKGIDLAKKSGLKNSHISKFRAEQNIRIDTLERILAAMPTEARRYMLNLVAEDDPEAEDPPPKSDQGDSSEDS